jgi:hypothetical protein
MRVILNYESTESNEGPVYILSIESNKDLKGITRRCPDHQIRSLSKLKYCSKILLFLFVAAARYEYERNERCLRARTSILCEIMIWCYYLKKHHYVIA